jgi:hypothetical protein
LLSEAIPVAIRALLFHHRATEVTEEGLNLREGTVPVEAMKTVSRRVAELAGKDKKLVRLNPDLIRSSLRSLCL